MTQEEKLKHLARQKVILRRFKEALEDEYMADFIDYLYELNFFSVQTEENLDYLEEELDDFAEEHYAQIGLQNRGITIIIARWDNWKYIAIDPTSCFDSPKRSSVLAYFPMSKREYNRFFKFFKKINGEDPQMRRDWVKEAPGCMWGEYALFGEGGPLN